MLSGSMTMHPCCPGGCLWLPTITENGQLKRPKGYVVERYNLYKKTVCGPSSSA